MPAGEADLEVVLRWSRSIECFDVSLAYDDPTDTYDRRDLVFDPVAIDTDMLDAADDEPAYGAILSAMLFAAPQVRDVFMAARARAQQRRRPLHLRLHLDVRAPERFQRLRWESLRDPATEEPLATSADVLLSRYLSSAEWRRVIPPPRHDLKALVVIANPSGLDRYTPHGRALHPVDVLAELDRARVALDGIGVRELASRGSATLDAILAELENGIDVLYLVCHGALTNSEPRLFLERPDGTVDEVDGTPLATRLRDLGHRPTLAVLCSCRSAGADSTSDAGALSALGPQLAAAGVAAVVAMQDDISMETAGSFLTAFFRALRDHGVVDRAVAAARNVVRQRPDWWVPVLFSRLRSGRTYYRPAFADESEDTFAAIAGPIRERECTPVIGSGMADQLLPSREEIARRWADRWQLPISEHARSELAKVAQVLQVRTAAETPRTELRVFMREEFRKQWGEVLDEALFRPERFSDLLLEVARAHRAANAEDPYAVVARLDLPVYITTSWTGLLEDALRHADREPIVRSFAWHSDRVDVDGSLDFDPGDTQHPLVYHLFGRIEEPRSIVLSEDDYFAWLSAWMRRGDLIPNVIRQALTGQSQMFLGYRLDGWEFRMLHQAIKSFAGASLLRSFVHVGVQLSPEDNLDIEPESAQEYLEKVFSRDSLHIFWGRSQGFLDQLATYLKR